jgi:hypothetical protein
MDRNLYERQLDGAWREAMKIVFQQQVLETATEFPSSLSKREKRIRDSAIDFIAKQTGAAPEYVSNALIEAAHNYLGAPNGEADPEWLQPPDWTGFKAGWEVRTEVVVPQAGGDLSIGQ